MPEPPCKGSQQFNEHLQDHSDEPMSGAGSLVDLDQQILSNAKYSCRLTPNDGGGKLDQNLFQIMDQRINSVVYV